MKLSSIYFLIAAPLFISCASAPWHETPSATTVGKNNASFALSYHAISTTGFKFTYGAAEKLDLGVQLEIGALFSSMGVNGRYALILPEAERQGWALSGDLGTGYSASDSRYVYGGLSSSYRWRWIEPHLVTRANYVWNKEHYGFTIGDNHFDISPDDFGYIYSVAGLTFWPAKSFALYIQGTFFNQNYSGLQIGLFFRSP